MGQQFRFTLNGGQRGWAISGFRVEGLGFKCAAVFGSRVLVLLD